MGGTGDARGIPPAPTDAEDGGRAVLVVGGGPAGLRAALGLADLGVQVVLVERDAAVGGVFTQLDAQYPSVDCGACQMLESVTGPPWPERRCLRTGIQHPFVQVLTSTTVASAERGPRGFDVGLRQRGRWIDAEACIGCGHCAEVCLVTVSDEHECGVRERKAAFRRHPQAQPSVFVIDEATCSRCGECVAGCPSSAIDLDREPEDRSVQVGAVVLAAGFAGFDPARQPQWAYGRHPDVVTALELERLMSPVVQSGGNLQRRSGGGKVDRVAFVQCVGSRDEERPYCSSICCMHALKEAILLRERLEVSTCDVYAIDMRCVGKGYEATLNRALEAGVRIIHARPGAVELGERPLLRVEQPPFGQRAEPYDLVVLSTGMVPAAGAKDLARLFEVELDAFGFVRAGEGGRASTSAAGVFACGGLTGPCDIPGAVTAAGEAAMLAAAFVSGATGREHTFAPPEDEPAELRRPDMVPEIPLAPRSTGRPPLGPELAPAPVPVTDRAFVVGGGPAGLTAALAISGAGHDVTVVERSAEAGGILRRMATRLGGGDPRELLSDLLESVAGDERIELLLETELTSHRGGPGAYVATVRNVRTGVERRIPHGAAVVATGLEEHEPGEAYLHGTHPAVVTQLELEDRLARGQGPGEGATVVMLQCVGSRNEERPFCSGVCCQEAVKNSLELLRRAPGTRVIVLHRDLRTTGFNEEHYLRARQAGVVFVRVDEERPPRLEAREGIVAVHFDDPLLDRPVRADADLVVLSVAAIPSHSLGDLPSILGLRLDEGGFVEEANTKWRPGEASRRGIFVAGFAAGPVLLGEAMTQARGAAARALALLSRSVVHPRPGAIAFRAKWCAACGLCVEVCPSAARELEEGRGAVVHAGLCQGCGACVVACPSGCTDAFGLDDRSVLAMIEEVVS